jgi:hypothetical protein
LNCRDPFAFTPVDVYIGSMIHSIEGKTQV